MGILKASDIDAHDGPAASRTAASPASNASLAKLDPAQIPETERFAWQPKELAAVVGSHRLRHWGAVTGVVFSPRGDLLASAGMDGFVRLWNKAGRETAALKVPASSVNCVAFSPDQRLLLAGGENGVIYVWKLGHAAPEELAPLVPAPQPPQSAPLPIGVAIDAIEFSADGRFLACSMGRQTNVRMLLWDTSKWPPREVPAALLTAPAPFAFAADSKTLYTQDGQGGVANWDLTGEQPEKKAAGQLESPRGQLLTMAISPSGKRLATCYGDAGALRLNGEPRGDVVLWDVTVSPPKPTAAFGEFKRDPMFFMLRAAVFSPDGNSLAFAADGRRAELWDVAADPPKKQATLKGEISQASGMAFSADGRALAASGSNEVLIWKLAEGAATPIRESAKFIGFAAVSPAGRWLATAETSGRDDEIASRLWDLSTQTPRPHASTVIGMPIVFGTDGMLITMELGRQGAGEKPANLRRYEVTTDGPREVGASQSPAFHTMFGGGQMHPSGVAIAIGNGKEGELLLWRIGDKGEPTSYKVTVPTNSELHPKAAAADGSAVAANVGDFQNTSVKVWKLAEGAPKELATVRPNPVSPALPGVGNADRASDVESPAGANKVERQASPEPRPFQLWTLAVAPAGEAVALADLEGTIQVWQLGAEKPHVQTSFVAHRQGHVMGAVQRMTFSNDGRHLLTIGSDCKLSVWDRATGLAIYTATFPAAPTDACFAADGRHVLTLNPNGTLYILRLPVSR